MINRKPIPELDQAIEAHARAILSGDHQAAERLVAPSGLETHRAALKEMAGSSLESFEVLARAKIGFHHIAKVRWIGPRGRAVVHQNRWRQEDDRSWKIVEVEDLTGKRSPWHDIPPLRARSEDRNA